MKTFEDKDSQNVQKVIYDEQTGEMTIWFKSRNGSPSAKYIYEGIEEAFFNKFKLAESRGRYVNYNKRFLSERQVYPERRI